MSNNNKDVGNYGLKSDYIINVSRKLFTHIFMLVHGFNPSDLLASSIVKDINMSLNNSSTYRGISLINPICKLLDYVIIDIPRDQLMTSDM